MSRVNTVDFDLLKFMRDRGCWHISFGIESGNIEQSIQSALDMPLDDIVVTTNTPIPGSPQYAEAKQFGSLDESDRSKYNYWRPVFVPHGLTQDDLLAKHREFYRRFFIRPRIMWRYFQSFLSPSGPRRFATRLRTLPFLLFREKIKQPNKAA